ncbi:MAG: hypothetical protein ACR2PF_07665, partial [Rhizobiaceae bacterium]
MARRKSKTASKRKVPKLSAKPEKAKTKTLKASKDGRPPATNARKTATLKSGKNGHGWARRAMRRTFKFGLIAALFFLLLPVAVTLSYKPGAVHPVSTLMIWNKI